MKETIGVPASIQTGDSLRFTMLAADYPVADGWALSCRLANADHNYTMQALVGGAQHTFAVPAATTAGYCPGQYRYQVIATLNDEVHTLAMGETVIQASLDQARDLRTPAEITLQKIEDWMTNRNPAIASYQIQGRSMQYIPLPELYSLRRQLKNEVATEKRLKRGVGNARTVGVRRI